MYHVWKMSIFFWSCVSWTVYFPYFWHGVLRVACYLVWLCVLSGDIVRCRAQIKLFLGNLILWRGIRGFMNAVEETDFVCAVLRKEWKGCHSEVILIACITDLAIHCLLLSISLSLSYFSRSYPELLATARLLCRPITMLFNKNAAGTLFCSLLNFTLPSFNSTIIPS